MPFITKDKTNPKYILIVAVLAVIVGGGSLIYWRSMKTGVPRGVLLFPISSCDRWHNDIENAFEEANFCEKDEDCKAVALGGPYVEFGCFKFVNVKVDESELFRRVKMYDEKCDIAIDKCAPVPEVTCVLDKCIEKSDLILFEKDEGWGDCPPDAICRQSTKLYYSGELVLEGETNMRKQLDAETMEKIKNQIKSSDIMNKDCPVGVIIVDYVATYTLNLNGQAKTVNFPGCEEELREIERLINP